VKAGGKQNNLPAGNSGFYRKQKGSGRVVSGSAYFLTLNLEAMCSCETSVDTQWTTWHYSPEDGTPQILHLKYNLLDIYQSKKKSQRKAVEKNEFFFCLIHFFYLTVFQIIKTNVNKCTRTVTLCMHVLSLQVQRAKTNNHKEMLTSCKRVAQYCMKHWRQKAMQVS
jgi:hypothetical protein